MSNIILGKSNKKDDEQELVETPTQEAFRHSLDKTPKRINIPSTDISPRSPRVPSPSGSVSPKPPSRNTSPRNRFLNKIRSLHSSPEKRNISTLTHSDRIPRKDMNDYEFQRNNLAKSPSEPYHSPQRIGDEKKSISSYDLQKTVHEARMNEGYDSSPPLSPTTSTTSFSSVSPREDTIKIRYRYHCHCCHGKLQVKQFLQISSSEDSSNESIDNYENYILAVQCNCQPKRQFFCSRLCHRTHYLGLSAEERKICQENKFSEIKSEIKMNGKSFAINPLEIPLVWTDVQYVHPLSEYDEN